MRSRALRRDPPVGRNLVPHHVAIRSAQPPLRDSTLALTRGLRSLSGVSVEAIGDCSALSPRGASRPAATPSRTVAGGWSSCGSPMRAGRARYRSRAPSAGAGGGHHRRPPNRDPHRHAATEIATRTSQPARLTQRRGSQSAIRSSDRQQRSIQLDRRDRQPRSLEQPAGDGSVGATSRHRVSRAEDPLLILLRARRRSGPRSMSLGFRWRCIGPRHRRTSR